MSALHELAAVEPPCRSPRQKQSLPSLHTIFPIDPVLFSAGTQAERRTLHELRVRSRDPLRKHLQPGLGLHPRGAAHVPRRPEVRDSVGRGYARQGVTTAVICTLGTDPRLLVVFWVAYRSCFKYIVLLLRGVARRGMFVARACFVFCGATSPAACLVRV